MIFVTVGTQLPFDRMIRAIDRWAARTGRTDLFAQTGPSQYKPQRFPASSFIEAQEFRRRVEEADAVIAHAGMGSIITALELGKPIIVMPRRADLGEHRNDHQLSTARHFLAQGRIIVAFDEEQLTEKLDALDRFKAAARLDRHASPQLLSALQAFVHGQEVLTPFPSGAQDVVTDSPSTPTDFEHDAPSSRLQGKPV